MRVWIAAALVAVAIAGCGDDAQPSPLAQSGVSKPSYIAAGDEICAKGDRELTREGRRIARGGAAELRRSVEETIVPVLEMRVADLRALEPPAGDEEQVAEIYDAAERSLERIRQDPEQVERAEEVFEPASRLAASYGFSDCAGRGSGARSLTGG